ALHEPRNLLDPIDELGEPEERMEIAKAALAFLDVGFQHIARAPAVKLVAPVSLSQLGLDEGSGAAFLHLPTEAPSQLHKKRLITPEIAAFQQTCGNRRVPPRQAQGFVQGAGGVPHLESEIPKQ